MYMGIITIMTEIYKKSSNKKFISKIFLLTYYKKCATLFESGVVKNFMQFVQPMVPYPSATFSRSP